jgi:hypothetical protein
MYVTPDAGDYAMEQIIHAFFGRCTISRLVTPGDRTGNGQIHRTVSPANNTTSVSMVFSVHLGRNAGQS